MLFHRELILPTSTNFLISTPLSISNFVRIFLLQNLIFPPSYNGSICESHLLVIESITFLGNSLDENNCSMTSVETTTSTGCIDPYFL